MLLKPTSYAAESQGSLVKVKLGNVNVTMDYNTALEIGALLRLRGRESRRNAGDTGARIRALGCLSDANEDEKRWQGLRDVTAAFK